MIKLSLNYYVRGVIRFVLGRLNDRLLGHKEQLNYSEVHCTVGVDHWFE